MRTKTWKLLHGSYEENGQLWKSRGVSETIGSYKEKCVSIGICLCGTYTVHIYGLIGWGGFL
jgi:hypothetical protein